MQDRVRSLNDAPVCQCARYVLYWAQMNRRVNSNHALEFAIARANALKLPVLFYEELSCAEPYANDRFHTFILQGVPEQQRRLSRRGIGYCFNLRKRPADPPDVLHRLAADAALLVTDDYPLLAPVKLDIPCLAVDSSCIVPMNLLPKREYAAYTIRPKIRRLLPNFLVPCPETPVRAKWTLPASEWHTTVKPENIGALVEESSIDHSIKPSLCYEGGRVSAERTLERFLENNLRRYARERNEPSAHATSNLSSFLHFGMISSLEVALAVKCHAEVNSLIPDEFLEELIVRRELAFNFARHVKNPPSFDDLPDWARKTLDEHASDAREFSYDLPAFERALTHDALWNACQKELLLTGKIHGYYRMYWGKKIIEWSRSCRDAFSTMVYLHDRYALDGRDPNTYTNILWCFGLHDRPWQERPIFGMIRYMSLDGMKRKTGVDAYLREIATLERTSCRSL